MKANEKNLSRMVNVISRGWPPGVRYEALKKAKNYALSAGISFPENAQRQLTDAAKETLVDVINYERAKREEEAGRK